MSRRRQWLVDGIHLDRPVTGMERYTFWLLDALRSLPGAPEIRVLRRGRLPAAVANAFLLPAVAWLRRPEWLICAGYPPPPPVLPLARRMALVTYDTVWLEQEATLSFGSRYWHRHNFRRALRRAALAIAISEHTAASVRRYRTGPVLVARPAVHDVFGLAGAEPRPPGAGEELRILAVGTVEPRKRLPLAARGVARLAERLGRPAVLEVVGRRGWGGDWEELAAMPHVRLHGHRPAEFLRELVPRCHLLVQASIEEGLGLPPLEVQYGGLPVVAAAIPALQEMLRGGAVFFPGADPSPEDVAGAMAGLLEDPEAWRRCAAEARENVRRHNERTAADLEALAQALAAPR